MNTISNREFKKVYRRLFWKDYERRGGTIPDHIFEKDSETFSVSSGRTADRMADYEKKSW